MTLINVADYLRRAAARRPDAVALRCGGTSTTYAALDDRADRYAHLLRELGLRPGERVGLLAEKSAETVAAMQGVARADGIYVPMDTHFPTSRLRAIAAHCGLSRVVCDADSRRHLPELAQAGVRSAVLTEDCEPPRIEGLEVLARSALDAAAVKPVTPMRGRDDVANILYTSGSTGEPKGVMITHGNVAAFVDWTAWAFGVGPDDRLLNHSRFTFDLSVFDLYAGFLAGATVVLLREEDALFPAATVQLLFEEEITSLYIVPSALVSLMSRGGLLRRDPSRLRRVLYAGEPFPVPHLRTLIGWLAPKTVVANLYGPIETNVATVYRVTHIPDDATSIPIGHASSGDRISVRDEHGAPCPPGTQGEIWVAGPTVTPGYWNNEALTATKIALADEQRWYRTGDIGSVGLDGLLSFHGRTDHMVKSRGFRIELGDIEAAMLSHPAVTEAAVGARPDPALGSVLYGWYSARAPLSPSELKSHITKALPSYMIPVELFLRDELPKTNSGKISRRALLDELELSLAKEPQTR